MLAYERIDISHGIDVNKSYESVYRICFLFKSKHEAKELMANSNAIDKKGFL